MEKPKINWKTKENSSGAFMTCNHVYNIFLKNLSIYEQTKQNCTNIFSLIGSAIIAA